jgi:hypothetical protein
MSGVLTPATTDEALAMLNAAWGFLANLDPAALPTPVLAGCFLGMERADAVAAAARGPMLAAFDAQDGPVAHGQRNIRTWLVHTARVTKGQAFEHQAVQRLAEAHRPLLAGLREQAVTRSVALQLAKWTRAIPDEYRGQAEEILIAAAKAGADLRALAAICAEIRSRTAPPDPDGRPGPDRGVSLETTMDGAGVLRGDLTPECAAMVQAVLDALSAPAGGGDLRTRPERYHDALEEAMRRLLASGLLPRRAGQPVKALVHVTFADLCALDTDSALQEQWITGYRARWAAQRAAASVSTGDGGAWLDGDAARRITCDAMLIPVVTGDLDPAALEDLIALCVRYHLLRTTHGGNPEDPATTQGPAGTIDPAKTQDPAGAGDSAAIQDLASTHDPAGAWAPAGAHSPEGPDSPAVPEGLISSAARQAREAAAVAGMLAGLEHDIIARVLTVVSGPGGVASFLRRQLLGKGLNGPSLPLDVGQTDDIPIHLRRLVDLRDQRCAHPGGCDQPASGCEAHHVIHRQDGGPTSLVNLKDFCWWHHHVLLHELGWQLTVHPDGTSQVTSPDGTTIHSHSPPPRSG